MTYLYPRKNIMLGSGGLVITRMLLICLLSFTSQAVFAAYCSLRDPVAAIQTLFPAANQHRSLVRNVSLESRNTVKQRLPFDLHFNEIGRHTVYLVFNDTRPEGVVHARSEVSEWGLIEIAWALDMNLTVRDFYFQRCRLPACNEALRLRILADLKGKSADQIASYVDVTGKHLAPALQEKYEADAPIALALIASAMKTILLTGSEWGGALEAARLDYFTLLATDELGGANKIKLVKKHRGSTVVEAGQYYDQFILIGSEDVYSVLSENSTEIATLVSVLWRHNDQLGRSVWIFDRQGKINHVALLDTDLDDSFNDSFLDLKGKSVASVDDCKTPTEMTARTIFLLSQLK